MGETCQNDVRERMGGCALGADSEFCTSSPKSQEVIVSTSECAGSAPLMSHFFMLKKMIFSAFLLPWKIFVRINEMVLIKHLGEQRYIDN